MSATTRPGPSSATEALLVCLLWLIVPFIALFGAGFLLADALRRRLQRPTTSTDG